jgi:hypothetical protein
MLPGFNISGSAGLPCRCLYECSTAGPSSCRQAVRAPVYPAATVLTKCGAPQWGSVPNLAWGRTRMGGRRQRKFGGVCERVVYLSASMICFAAWSVFL